MKKTLTNLLVVVGLLSIGLLTMAQSCTSSNSQVQSQTTIENFAKKLIAAQPYPSDAMYDSAERANLRERLLRMNNPNKIGYFYGLSMAGQVMLFATIKGKPSSMGSYLTAGENILSYSGGSIAVEAMGDDGSYGSAECESQGVFFFTAQGVLGEWCGPWAYFDAPVQLASAPLMIMDANAKPSTTAGVVDFSPDK